MIGTTIQACLVLTVIFTSAAGWEVFNKEDCKLPADAGNCSFAVTRYYFNDIVKACQRFTWTGCAGNNNRFRKVEQCIANCGGVDICHQPPPIGDCGESSERFCFDKFEGKCVPFTFGGCTNSLNNFMTLEACQAECSGRVDCSDDSKPH